MFEADHKLSEPMVLAATSKTLHLKDVQYDAPGPLPRVLLNSDKTIKKADRSTLARHLQKKFLSEDNIWQPSHCTSDGVALVNRTHEKEIFTELLRHLLPASFGAGTGIRRKLIPVMKHLSTVE